MEIEQITVFKTEDGQYFESGDEALKHAKELRFVGFFFDEIGVCDGCAAELLAALPKVISFLIKEGYVDSKRTTGYHDVDEYHKD